MNDTDLIRRLTEQLEAAQEAYEQAELAYFAAHNDALGADGGNTLEAAATLDEAKHNLDRASAALAEAAGW